MPLKFKKRSTSAVVHLAELRSPFSMGFDVSIPLKHAQIVSPDVRQSDIQSDFTSQSRDFLSCRLWQFLSLHVSFSAQTVRFRHCFGVSECARNCFSYLRVFNHGNFPDVFRFVCGSVAAQWACFFEIKSSDEVSCQWAQKEKTEALLRDLKSSQLSQTEDK